MNFRDLVTRLDLIENAGLTLATVQSAEQAAKEQASMEKTKGGWTGFTSHDPKTAGNIAVAKLAQQNGLDGLFNSEGDFIVAYGNNEWSSKVGQAPRAAPPTPEDWKPLATRGLIPANAKGPAGLTNWLTGGKSQQEFDAVKQQSADVQAAPQTDIQKADEVDDLINQYLSKEVSSTDNEPIRLAGADIESTGSEADRALAENIYESLVESFGYQAEDFSSSWDEFNKFPIITLPNGTVIYDGEDLIFDLGLSIVIATVGPAAGPLIMPRLYKLANIIKKVFGASKPVSKAAISAVAKTYKEALAAGWRSHLGSKALATTAGVTAGANALLVWIENVLKDKYDPANPSIKSGNTSMPAVDVMGNATGQSN
jgi:hypothetical protein